jgi:hypothetical protein
MYFKKFGVDSSLFSLIVEIAVVGRRSRRYKGRLLTIRSPVDPTLLHTPPWWTLDSLWHCVARILSIILYSLATKEVGILTEE